jgi:membrane-bound metal-dependent hydrolase YbcI (DUF457 family)
MPGYRGHIAGGAAFGVTGIAAAAVLIGFRPAPLDAGIMLAIAMAAALVPDIDTDSKGQNLVYALLVVADLVLIGLEEYRWAALLGLTAMFPALGRHRGWTHAFWAAAVMPLPILIVPALFFETNWQAMLPFYLAAVAGYASHLVLDEVF